MLFHGFFSKKKKIRYVSKNVFESKSLLSIDLGVPLFCLHKANGNPALKYACEILILWEPRQKLLDKSFR